MGDDTLNIGGSKGAGRQGRAPLWVQIFSFSCSFGGKLGKIIGWCPQLYGWRPLLWKILDPPLLNQVIGMVCMLPYCKYI